MYTTDIKHINLVRNGKNIETLDRKTLNFLAKTYNISQYNFKCCTPKP